MSMLQRVAGAAWSLIVSHLITLREMLRRPVTVRYPEEKAPPILGTRDIPALKINEETGLLNCTHAGSANGPARRARSRSCRQWSLRPGAGNPGRSSTNCTTTIVWSATSAWRSVPLMHWKWRP